MSAIVSPMCLLETWAVISARSSSSFTELILSFTVQRNRHRTRNSILLWPQLNQRDMPVGCNITSQTRSSTQWGTRSATAVYINAVIRVYNEAGNVIGVH